MEMSCDHKLIDFVQIFKEKQRNIEKEMKKIQDRRADLHQNISSVEGFTRQLQESKERLTAEVDKCRDEIKMRVDEHHDGLIDEINSTIDSLLESLEEIKPLFAKCDSKLGDKIGLLSDVSNS